MFYKIISTTALIASLSVGSIAIARNAQTTSAIDPSAPILTMINVLTPKNGDQDALVAQLELALQSTLINEPGFISGNVHKSLDSKHVVNYAQWEDQKSLEAFVAKLQSGNAPDMAQVFTMATPDFHPYKIMSVHQSKN
ncbi:antibiotic biosynthesis monooxygenase family protein [Lentilitoribacter sp. EG35]|uniref:antibiotic biosynthesis monooxygenase family protein n=1 Tax=Lentilitoribacter sp. EG35 TaxID=3234192 RepID=UPI0034608330